VANAVLARYSVPWRNDALAGVRELQRLEY